MVASSSCLTLNRCTQHYKPHQVHVYPAPVLDKHLLQCWYTCPYKLRAKPAASVQLLQLIQGGCCCRTSAVVHTAETFVMEHDWDAVRRQLAVCLKVLETLGEGQVKCVQGILWCCTAVTSVGDDDGARWICHDSREPRHHK